MIEAGFGVTAMETKTAAVPLPLRETVCGLLLALSLTVNVPARLPRIEGSKVTEMVQLPPIASVPGNNGQVVVCWKSLRPVEMLVIAKAVV